MTRSTKAALLSGLIFPGVGHMVLKRYLRGSILMLFALTAMLVIVTKVTKQALTILDEINSGEVLAEAATITDLVAKTTSGAEDPIMNIAVLVVGACWLIGIADSYRLGIIEEK